MKKIIWLLVLLMPFYVFAYSKYIIPGGDTLGIEVNSKGLVVVGFYNVNGNQINDDLKIGDRIIKVNDISINKITDLNKLIKKYDKDELFITYVRNDKEYEYKLEVLLSNGTYKTGLYVKESVLGIGTLTYIDPSTGVYGILGHSLNLSQTNQKFVVKDGFSYEAVVTNFIKSNNGNPGSKNADIDKDNVFGTVEVNTDYGVFGIIDEDTNKGLLEVGDIDDIKVGAAYIRTTNEKNEVINYEINIIEVNENNTDRNIYFEVVDERLIKMSGGIVQGMSGSPIIQGDYIIGAVTRVLVDDVSKGYGISIVTMLEEGDKLVE
jgi:stage IV sporulation protein B